MSFKELCAYETPSVAELQNFLLSDRRPTGHVNQVWPNVYIGNECVLFFFIQMEIYKMHRTTDVLCFVLSGLRHVTNQCCTIWGSHTL